MRVGSTDVSLRSRLTVASGRRDPPETASESSTPAHLPRVEEAGSLAPPLLTFRLAFWPWNVHTRIQMDPAILSATAALVGSLVGGVSTFAAYWLTQRVQIRAQGLMKRHAQREALYAEFIVEASKRFADAWSHHAESPEVLAGLFSAIERMRLTSSDAVIVAAERVMHNILEAYAQPDKSFDDLRRSIHGEQFPNKLRDFSEACKNELRALTE
jgi:hypothetical protein